MNAPEPIDHYTDSDDDETVVVKKILGVKQKEVHLTIDTRFPRDEDEDTDSRDNRRFCYLLSWIMAEICLSCCCCFKIF